jgi:predicted ATPase
MIRSSEIHKYAGFKLISLDLRDNALMNKSDLFYDFIDSEDKQELIYSTIIIGANGTGKSNLFRIIIELFKELNDLKEGGTRSYNVDGRFNLKYSLHGDIYEYGNILDGGELKNIQVITGNGQNPVYLMKNGNKIDFKTALLPIAIVANSIMLTDKYPFYRKETMKDGKKTETFPQYKYLGVRNIAQNASTRAYVRKTVEFIVKQFDSSAFRSGLENATKFLGLANAIEIFYYTSNTAKFFKGNISPKVLNEYFQKIKADYADSTTTPPYKLRHYLNLKKDKDQIVLICEFCNKLFKNNRLVAIDKRHRMNKKIIYDIIDNKTFQLLKRDFEMLEHLRQLGMISPPEIQLKRTDGYTLQESSSGEYHFFSSVVGLMATVRTNSLVFIDEPEISLHPNWQMQYLSFIRQLFANPEYKNSHILIATHSHFLISDLTSENSKIIGLKRENNKIEIVDLPQHLNTFGWSAEEVLYSIFNVRSTRNSFLEYDLTKLVTLVNKGSNEYSEIKRILGKISGLVLSESDPLKVLKEKAEKYLHQNNA